jgi:hypothetical protein
MKFSLPKVLLATLVAFALSVNFALAASLTLTKIGSLEVGGKKISGQWTYTSTNPTLYGTAPAGARVTINIDGTDAAEVADESGNWHHYSEKLTNGNHQITISIDGESFSFSLYIGTGSPEGTASAGTNPVPITGSSSLLTYIVISSVLLIGGGFLLLNKRR